MDASLKCAVRAGTAKIPFAVSDGTAGLQQELLKRVDVGKVQALQTQVQVVLRAEMIRLADLRHVTQWSKDLQKQLHIDHADRLVHVGWPCKELARCEHVLRMVDAWDALLAQVQERMKAPNTMGGPILLKQLAEAWAAISKLDKAYKEIQDRARSAAGLVTAFADRLAADARRGEPTFLGLRQGLAAVLCDQKLCSILEDLGAELPPLESKSQGPAPPRVPGVGCESTKEPSKKDAFLQCLERGEEVQAMLLVEEALKSGRDGRKGLSVFLLSILHGLPAVALRIWELFPPDGGCRGVDTSETTTSGDTLMHVICRAKKFDSLHAELVSKLLRSIGEAPIISQKNDAGQTFLHVAAARLNCRVLAQCLTIVPNLVTGVVELDSAGQTPLSILARHLECLGGVPPTPSHDEVRAASKPVGGAEVALEVEDEVSGKLVRITCKASILKGSTWATDLREGCCLKVDSACCRSACAVRAAMLFLDGQPLALSDGRTLWQLLSFTVQYRLPGDLRRASISSLLRSLEDPINAPVLPMLIRGAQAAGLCEEQRRYVLFKMLTTPDALASAGHSNHGLQRQAKVVQAVLSEMEHQIRQMKSRSANVHHPDEGVDANTRRTPRALDVPLRGPEMRQAVSRLQPA